MISKIKGEKGGLLCGAIDENIITMMAMGNGDDEAFHIAMYSPVPVEMRNK